MKTYEEVAIKQAQSELMKLLGEHYERAMFEVNTMNDVYYQLGIRDGRQQVAEQIKTILTKADRE